MLPTIQQLKFSDRELNRLQQNVATALRPVLQASLLDGVLIRNVTLDGVAPTNVAHGLQHDVVGWIVVDSAQPARIYRAPQGGLPAALLPLQADAPTTISVWVF